jgi:hypothetical protein
MTSALNMAWKTRKRNLLALLPGLRRLRREKSWLPAPVVPHPRRGGIAVVAIVKDEAHYIAEWLDYHVLVGVRHFYIYDNGSTDGTCDVVRTSRWADQITIIPWQSFDTAIRIQNAAYNHALANFGSAFRWVAFLDVDEFVVPKHCDDLNKALAAFEDLSALSLPWHMFGPSGHTTRPTGRVIESYLERAEFPPRPDVLSLLNYKTIVDPARVRQARTHHVELLDESKVMYNDRRERFSYFDRFDPRHASAETIQLNHYFTRSLEEMREKIAKGRVSKDGRMRNVKYLEEQVRKLQKHIVRDETILRFVPALERIAGAKGNPARGAASKADEAVIAAASAEK